MAGKNKNRYRVMRSAILSASLLSVIPLVTVMKASAGVGGTSTATDTGALARAQTIATPAASAQTASSASSSASSTTASTKAAATPTQAATTYTRTKAS